MVQFKKLSLVSGIAVVLAALAAAQGITLRKTIKQGVESYHVQAKAKATIAMPGGGDQDLGTTAEESLSYKFGVAGTDGSAPVEVTTKIEKFDMEGPLADLLGDQKDKLLGSNTTSGKLDPLNRFTADKSDKIDPRSYLPGAANFSYVGPLVQFPDKPVGIGDTWDIPVPKGPTTGEVDQKLTAKLVGEKNGAYLVSVTGSLKVDVNVEKLMKDNPVTGLSGVDMTGMRVTGTMDIVGEGTLDMLTGQTLAIEYKIKDTKEFSLAVLGEQKIVSSGTTTIKFILDK